MTRPSPADYAEDRRIRAHDALICRLTGRAEVRTVRIKAFVVEGAPPLTLPVAAGLGQLWASVSESDGHMRLSVPSTDPGREVFQPNAMAGLCHGRASLPARRSCLR
jgi:hypothetical protein